MMEFLTELRSKNVTRQEEWPSEIKVDLMFRATELGGEVGELLGATKKVFRSLHKIAGNGNQVQHYIDNAREEIGDVLICLDLLAAKLEQETEQKFDLADCTRAKFNATSRKVGLNTVFEEEEDVRYE